MKKIALKEVLLGMIFFYVMLIGCTYIVLGAEIEQKNMIVFITFGINIVISSINLFKKNSIGYKLMDMFNLFFLIFMGIAPLIQYISRAFPWGDIILIDDRIVIYTNIIISLFLMVFFLTDRIYKKVKIKDYKKMNVINFKCEKSILEIGFYLSVACSLYIIWKTGIYNLFSRSTNSLDMNQTIGLIINSVFRTFPIIMISMNLVYRNINKVFYNINYFVVICVLGVLINFPTGLPRFQVAAVYIGILIALRVKFNNKYIFKFLILFGLLFIFPVINIFRNNNWNEILNLSITIPNPSVDFLSGDFDSYSMLSRSILYVNDFGVEYGRQLLGVLLFFVPRSLWQTKPIGSGAHMAEAFNWPFTNISCPYVGEGYINYGLGGVILFAVILSIIISRIDYRYELIIIEQIKKITVLRVIYPFILGFVFFILRGDLLSSVSYIIGFIFPIIILYIIDSIIYIYCRKVKAYQN